MIQGNSKKEVVLSKVKSEKVEAYLILVQGFKALRQFLNLFQLTRIISMSCAQILKNLSATVHVEMSDGTAFDPTSKETRLVSLKLWKPVWCQQQQNDTRTCQLADLVVIIF